jgi:hypothetical protein
MVTVHDAVKTHAVRGKKGMRWVDRKAVSLVRI